MKRYDIEDVISPENGRLLDVVMTEKPDGKYYYVLEVEAELAKKDELYNELYVITNEEMDKLAAKIAQLSKALEKIRDMDAGSLIGSHYRDSIVGVAREALGKEGE